MSKVSLFYAALLIIAVVFCIRLVHEPDLWWQLRTGEYILQNGSVPTNDVFSFTYEGKPWLNVKWGFEVIQAVIVGALGPTFLPLPQLFANVILVLLLLKITRLLAQNSPIKETVEAVAILLFLIGFSYRMNGRPELVTYTFTAFYLFVFAKIWQGNTRWAWAIMPAQVFWANLHEAYGVGVVMSAVFIGSWWLDVTLYQKKSDAIKKMLWRTTGILVSSWLATALHPGGLRMLWHPYEIFSQLAENQFTQEIYSATHKAYWHMPAFAGVSLGVIAALHLWQSAKSKGKFSIKQLREKYPPFYLFLFIAFFYLSLKSYRNLPFLLIMSTPLVAAQLQKWVAKLPDKAVNWGFAVLAFGLYISIVTNHFYRTFLPAETFGWGISQAKNPVGAAEFIAKKNLEGPAFSDYLSSSYLLWHLQPNFKTFVDLRDLDVFEADDMEVALILCNQPTRLTADGRAIWEIVDERYHFNYVVVLNNPDFMPLHRYLLAGKTFKLAYADALSSVFVRNIPAHQSLIPTDVATVFQPTKPQETSRLAQLFWPVYTPQNQSDANFTAIRQSYFRALGINVR